MSRLNLSVMSSAILSCVTFEIFEKLRNVAGGVTNRRMAQFVGHHTCQLVFRLRERDQFARKEDISAGRVKGVRLRDVDNKELKLQSRGRQVTDQPFADFPDVSE